MIGAGYVGLVTGLGLAEIGHEVVCVDLDQRRVNRINEGTPPFYEDGLAELLSAHAGNRLTASTDLAQAVQHSEVTIIAVGTPFDGEQIALQQIETASSDVGRALADKDSYHVVVIKSTVVPGTTDSLVVPTLERASGKSAGRDFGVGMNPEFLREGNAIADFMEPDRIVLGAIDQRSQDVMAGLYKPFTAVEMVHTTPRTAEMIKYAANSLLATLISFSNEIANLAATVDVDAMEVMRGVHLDKRFTPLTDGGDRIWPGSITYLEPGCGFGGSCFPKDVRSLIAFGVQNQAPMPLLQAVIEINEAQPRRMLDLLSRHFSTIDGTPVTVLGMAFKPGTDDIRESPALIVTDELLARGAKVTVFDPVAHKPVEDRYGDRVRYADDLEDAISGAEAILLMTRWAEFERLPSLLDTREPQPLVVDGRRLLDPDSVERYEGIGR
jgi:UDPglucose 6-dehydrogenase